MDNVWVLIILFLGGAWLIGWILVRMDKRSRRMDKQRLTSVNSLHYHHQIFQSAFNEIDEKYTRLVANPRGDSDSSRELPDVMTSLLGLQEDLLNLRLHLTLRLIVDGKNWSLQDGYAKQAANYYHTRWESMVSTVTNKLRAVNQKLEKLGFDDSNSKATQQH